LWAPLATRLARPVKFERLAPVGRRVGRSAATIALQHPQLAVEQLD
jgi:hypothetical protein